MFTIMKQKV